MSLVPELNKLKVTFGDFGRDVDKTLSELFVETPATGSLVDRKDVSSRVTHVVLRHVVA
jgi:hypothetical protein